ncbi:uncharacterized protein [Dermacentor albipictus]|uniref:uncharacterized protein isoform X3 n=1 Tax=Dermacentor albipictus TaxID=60249 RepID=UPI0038FBE856
MAPIFQASPLIAEETLYRISRMAYESSLQPAILRLHVNRAWKSLSLLQPWIACHRTTIGKLASCMNSAARIWMSEGTKAMVDRLTCELVLSGTECDSIHDEQEQSDRERAIEEHHSVKEDTVRFWMSDLDDSVSR